MKQRLASASLVLDTNHSSSWSDPLTGKCQDGMQHIPLHRATNNPEGQPSTPALWWHSSGGISGEVPVLVTDSPISHGEWSFCWPSTSIPAPNDWFNHGNPVFLLVTGWGMDVWPNSIQSDWGDVPLRIFVGRIYGFCGIPWKELRDGVLHACDLLRNILGNNNYKKVKDPELGWKRSSLGEWSAWRPLPTQWSLWDWDDPSEIIPKGSQGLRHSPPASGPTRAPPAMRPLS